MVTLDQLIEIKEQELNILLNMKNQSSTDTKSAKTSVEAPEGELTIEQLAEKLGYKSTTSVYKLMDKLNLNPSSKLITPVGKDRLFYSQETLQKIKSYKSAQSALVGRVVPV